MKRTAKWLVLALCLVLCFAVFSGCQTPDDPAASQTPAASPTDSASAEPTQAPQAKYMKAGETYRILVWSNSVEDQPLTEEGIRGQMAQMKYDELINNYGVTPKYIVSPSDWVGEITNSTYAGSPITDLFHIGGPFTILSFYTFGGERGAVIEPVDQYGIEFNDSEYWDLTSQQAASFNGSQYMISPNYIGFDSVSLNAMTIFNKALIQKAGYTPEQLYNWSNNGEWTFAKFREVALACTNLDNDVYGTSVVQNAFLMSTMVASNGSDLFVNNSEGIPTFNLLDSKAMTAINFLIQMARDDKSVNLDYNSKEEAAFTTGNTAMIVTYANRIADKNVYLRMDDDYGMVMPPKGPDASDYISDKNWFDGYMVCKNTGHTAGAVEFASLFLKPVYSISSQEHVDLLEAQCQTYRLDAESIAILRKVPAISHSTSYIIYWSCDTGSGQVASVCNYQFPLFVDGSLSPDTYYASMESAINAAIKTALQL